MQAVIVGGGYIGLETAAGLSMNGLDVRSFTSHFDGEEVMSVDYNRPVVSQKHNLRRRVAFACGLLCCLQTLLLSRRYRMD